MRVVQRTGNAPSGTGAASTGAGANSRISIGTGIVGGTLTATALAIFFVPLFFVLVRGLFNWRGRPAATPTQEGTPP